MISREELIKLSKLNLGSIDISELKELTDIWIAPDAPVEIRLETFLEKIRNPYCFLVHGIPVEISFRNENQETLEECLLQYLIEKRNSDDM